MRRYGLAHAPEVVVLQFFINDAWNNSILSHQYLGLNNLYRPYSAEGEGLRVAWTSPVRRFLFVHLHLYGLLENAFSPLRMLRARLAQVVRGEIAWDESFSRTGYVDSLLQSLEDRAQKKLESEFNPRWFAYASDDRQIAPIADGWRVTERIIEAMLGPFEAQSHRVLPYWDGHLNPDGHRLAAEAIHASLVDDRIVAEVRSALRPPR